MTKSKNILWIMVDQMRADCLGMMGNSAVQTPNLDALAHRGVAFENVFAQFPICTPSRASIFTGRYVHSHGAWCNGVPISREAILLPEYLRDCGFDTSIIGKLHLFPQESDHGFNYRELHEEHLDDSLSGYVDFLNRNGQKGGLPGNQTDWQNKPIGICTMDEPYEETRWVANRARNWMREIRKENQPFFLYSSFLRPHSPYNPLERFARMYDDTKIDPPAFDSEEWDRIPPRHRMYAESKDFNHTSEEWTQLRLHYYALCTQVDESVGALLQALEDTGLAEDTLVLFTSDHGDYVGDHGLYGKGHPWDSAIHVPLIVYDPTDPGNGVRYPGLVESIDILPSVLDLVGLDIPQAVQGKSFMPAVRGEVEEHRSAVFSETVTHTNAQDVGPLFSVCPERHLITIRTKRWKYIHYVDEPGELYDLDSDPGERRNLIGLPEMTDTIATLRNRILDWTVQSSGFSAPDINNSYLNNYF